MITTTLNVPEHVRKNVDEYFAEGHGLANYEPIAVGQHRGNGEAEYLYVVLARQIRGGKWAVWTSWNESTQSLNFGHYDLTEQQAMRLFMNTEILHSPRPTEDRFADIADECIRALLIEADNAHALRFLRDKVELTEEECEYFGVDYDEMQEV